MSKVEKVSYIITESGSISLWLIKQGGTLQFTVSSDHPQHALIVDSLKKKTYDLLEELCSNSEELDKKIKAKRLERGLKALGPLVGKAEVRDGTVFVNDVPVHNVIAERIISLVSRGFPVDPILRFLELVLQNPNAKAQLELYDFLSNRNLPLTEDGHFLAYKRVRDDWLDIYSGTIDNSVGRVVEIPREQVDSNRERHCSSGLHVGALDYVRTYGSGGHVVIVKVNPMDVVSVPTDCSFQKLRTCRYEVLRELIQDAPLESPCYSTSGEEFRNVGEFVSANNHAFAEDVVDGDWTTGWVDEETPADDLESKSIDDLAYECRDVGLTATRQEGRDLGKAEMIRLLRAQHAKQNPAKVDHDDGWDNSKEETSLDENWQSSGECWVSSSQSCW